MSNFSYSFIQNLLNFTGVIVMVSRYAGVFDLIVNFFFIFYLFFFFFLQF